MWGKDSGDQPAVSEGPSPVVLLTNMVGPGEVDADLQPETAEECAKYGVVKNCVIYECPPKTVPDTEAVRIFIEYREISAARKAIADLNGRFFGGRNVKAQFYSISRYVCVVCWFAVLSIFWQMCTCAMYSYCSLCLTQRIILCSNAINV